MSDTSEYQDPIRELVAICLLNSTAIVSTQTHAYACKVREATQYLAVYKQSKHCPSTLICERVFKAQDLETLRAFSDPLHFTDLLSLVPGHHLPSASRLPGFGLKNSR
ncbi:hypothetical protein EDB89DRAFT_2076957 [Lactarius sanguifluus]|nr:hypothetical protein EDB89DRAFT_2076957 [Lactarius sanguifluus]